MNNNKINAIEVMRAFFILSVIMAHFSGKVYSVFTGFPLELFYCCRAFGTVGVVGFFIISGYLYKREPGDTKRFWSKKLLFIIAPTLIAGVINYTVLNIGNFNFLDMSVYCYGGGSHFYYITVLCICYMLFRKIYDNTACLLVSIIVNLLSLFLFASDIIVYEQLPYPLLTSYLLPTNWIGLFSLGILLRRKKCFEKILEFLGKYVFILTGVFLAATYLYAKLRANVEISYFVYEALPYELLGVITIAGIAYRLKESRLLFNVGSASFFIYLYHIHIIGFISNRFCKYWFLVILYPFIIVIVLTLLSSMMQKVTEGTKINQLLKFVGIKER